MFLPVAGGSGTVVNLGELMMILELHRQGLTVSAIARQLGLDRKTVAKYIARGLEPPAYGPRPPRSRATDLFVPYLRERLSAYPGLTAVRLWRELKERGFTGAYTAVKRAVAMIRPAAPLPIEVRFETPPGEQAQVDLARFEVEFTDEPGVKRIVWLFSLVLGHSRLIWARFFLHQDLQTILRCHTAAFAAIGGVPREILYDRMKTAVTGEDPEGLVIYNRVLLDLARHYGFQPRACRPCRAKTKGKVERPFRYIREDFFLARSFRDLEDLNAQLRHWLDTVANPRVHATTKRVVNEAFAEERPALKPLPLAPYRAVLELERRVSHDGMISVGGNAYSVPDTARRRVLDVHCLVDRIKTTLVGLRMLRALEIVDVIVRQLERGETTALEAIDSLLMEELTLRETRRVKTALVMARLSTLKTLAGFDFSFQPSLDRGRIMALAELK